MRRMLVAFLTAGALAASACAPRGEGNAQNGAGSCPALSQTPPPAYWARYAGDRRRLIHHGALDANIRLAELAGVPGLYAIGPVEQLKDEITIYDGVASISTIKDGAVAIDHSFDHAAIFLVYGAAAQWIAAPVDSALSGLEAIEAFVRDRALAAGLDPETPFPFRIEGVAQGLDYHVIFKTNDAPRNMAEHQRAKQRFSLINIPVKIAGFWADAQGEGVYTHPGKRTHLHFMTVDNSASGHVDGLTLETGATLFLPASKQFPTNAGVK